MPQKLKIEELEQKIAPITLTNFFQNHPVYLYDGTPGDDTFSLSNISYAQVNGYSGNDTLEAYYSSYINARLGSGNDFLYFDHVDSSQVNAGSGDDGMNIGYVNNSLFDTGHGNDQISNNYGSNNTFKFGAGEDYYFAGLSKNTIVYFDQGNDSCFLVEGSGNTYYGGNGNEEFTINGEIKSKLFGQAGDDHFTLKNFEEPDGTLIIKDYKDLVLSGGVGNDTFDVDVDSNKGSFLVDGGRGSDITNVTGTNITGYVVNHFPDGRDVVTINSSDGKNIAIEYKDIEQFKINGVKIKELLNSRMMELAA